MGDAADLTTRVGRLRNEANRYRERYGDLEELRPLDKLNEAVSSRRARLTQLRNLAAEIDLEIKTVETEMAGLERGVEALIGEILPTIGERFGEGWSPSPVLGYRIWAWSDGEMHGVRTQWTSTDMTATCRASGGGGEIPHSDGRCGRLGCGVYAAKDVRPLLKEFAPALQSSFAVGLVELSGKVVEHEHGYRGARASAVALVAVDRMHAEFTADPQRLRGLFSGAEIPMSYRTLPDRPSLFEAIVEYLTEQERNQNPWT